jgi:HSP20 family protein
VFIVKLVKYGPWRDMLDLEERVNRMFGDLAPRRIREESLIGSWEPAIDVYETDKDFVLKAELPEVEEKDVHLSMEGNILTIRGERRREEEVKEENYHRTERFYGSFCRSFALPDTVDRDKIKATFKGGVMKLNLPKKEVVKPKEIKIEVEK